MGVSGISGSSSSYQPSEPPSPYKNFINAYNAYMANPDSANFNALKSQLQQLLSNPNVSPQIKQDLQQIVDYAREYQLDNSLRKDALDEIPPNYQEAYYYAKLMNRDMQHLQTLLKQIPS